MPSTPETWPVGLPYTAQKDWSLERIHLPTLRSEMNAGTERTRRKYSARLAVAQFTMWLTAAQCKTLQEFVEDTLNDGAKRFTMQVWNFNEYVTRTCQFVENFPAFGQQVGFSGNDPLYAVTMKITIEELRNG